jgi:hypothetical protein
VSFNCKGIINNWSYTYNLIKNHDIGFFHETWIAKWDKNVIIDIKLLNKDIYTFFEPGGGAFNAALQLKESWRPKATNLRLYVITNKPISNRLNLLKKIDSINIKTQIEEGTINIDNSELSKLIDLVNDSLELLENNIEIDWEIKLNDFNQQCEIFKH